MTQASIESTTIQPKANLKTMKMTTYHPRTLASRLLPPSGGSYTPSNVETGAGRRTQSRRQKRSSMTRTA